MSFAAQLAAALGTINASAGVDVIYARGTAVCDVRMVPAKTDREIDRDAPPRFIGEPRDWIAAAGSIVLGAAIATPRPGDKIIETDAVAAKEYVYEVNAEAGEPCWRFCDSYRQALRIHSKLLEVTNAP